MSESLQADEQSFERFKQDAVEAYENGRYEQALAYAAVTGNIGWKTIPKWFDEDLEELLSSIGRQVLGDFTIAETGDSEVNIAYVTTFLADHGGHAETLRLWVKMLADQDSINDQHVLVTNAHNTPSSFPSLKDSLREAGVTVHQLGDGLSYVERIRLLGEKLQSIAPDRIVLFTSPDDVIAIPALAAASKRPQTVFYNHADHVFWYGREIVDDLVEYRAVGRDLSRRFRDLESKCIIPLATDVDGLAEVEPLFQFDEASTVSATLGSSYKVKPNANVNYFSAIEQFLIQHPNHRHVLVTDSPGEVKQFISSEVRDQFIVDGPVDDPRIVYAMADFLIDTMPYSGGMVRLEAISTGCPMVAYNDPKVPFIPEANILPEDYQYIARSTEEVVEYSSTLSESPTIRQSIANEFEKRFDQHHDPKVVSERLSRLLTRKPVEELWTGETTAMTFNMDDYRRNFRSAPKEHKQLLLEGLQKDSPFGILTRLRAYRGAVRNEEIRSVKELVGFLILSFFGERAYEYLK